MLDIIPRRLLSFPVLSSDFWGEDDNLMTTSSQSGLSVYEDDKNVYVEAALPGIDPKNIEVTFHEGYVWIRGEKKEEEKDKNKKFYRKATSSFSYRVAIPGDVDEKKEAEAVYENGVMKVIFAKAPKAQPKKIKIKVAKK